MRTFQMANGGTAVDMEIVKFCVVVPSRRRSDSIVTMPLLPVANVFVHESEVETYERHFAKREVPFGTVRPHSQQGMPRIRNYMLEQMLTDEVDFMFMADDDVRGLRLMMTRLSAPIIGDMRTILEVIATTGHTAKQFPVGIFGFHQSGVPRERRCQIPFYLRGWISSHACGVLDRDLRYDPRLRTHDDIDFSLQAIAKYGHAFRDERWYVDCLPSVGWNSTTGMAAFRSTKEEEDALALLQAKWGEQTIQRGDLQASGMAVVVTLNW